MTMKSIIIILVLFVSHIFAKSVQNWWQHATNYEIFVMSFKDSDGDGIGDLAGITSKLDYLHELGIHVIRLSSIYSSPDSITPNYGVDNFTQVHSKLGTLEDFEELITEANKRGIRIILDIDFNHCHSSHEWFQKSVDRVEPFKDYFVWEDPVVDEESSVLNPPNFLVSRRTGLLRWTWLERRRQFYYSSFNSELPHFNLYDRGLMEELKNILQFWLKKGISGFYIKNKLFYFERFNSKRQMKTHSQDIYDFFRELRDFIDIYNEENIGQQRILMTDSYDCGLYSLECFGNKDSPLVHVVSSNELSFLGYDRISRRYNLEKLLKSSSDFIKDGKIFEWQSYTLIRSRPRSEGDFNSHLTHTLLAVVPGTWHILYGSELGIGGSYEREKIFIENDFNFNTETILAMPWDDSKNAGFSDSTHPMYQPNIDYWKINAEKEKNVENSLYNFFKDLLEVREKDTMKYGDVNAFSVTKFSHGIVRTLEGHETYIIVMNLCNQFELIDLNKAVPPIPNLTPKLKIVASSPNFWHKKGIRVNTSHLSMRPFASVVLEMEEKSH